MNKTKIVILAFLAGICLICASCFIMPIIGNGELETTEVSVSSFNRIDAGGSTDIYYHQSEEYLVLLTIDSNLTNM